MATFTQAGQVSGNAVAEKRFDFAYNDAGQFTSLNRYADVAGTEFVAETTYAYDGIGRLASLQHAQGVTSLAGYDYTYDNASRITAIDSVLDGLTSYTNDYTGQLTGADHTGQTDESYGYDGVQDKRGHSRMSLFRGSLNTTNLYAWLSNAHRHH